MLKHLLWLLLFSPIFLSAQNDSCHLRISLLTASPGEDLYSTFGHSALRVTDSVSNTDIVYNYGTFNFEEPGFYLKFTRGKLLYFLSRDYYPSFIENYRLENRSITEQVLNLSCEKKKQINDLLQVNLLPENLYYQYDFLFDNCTTRLRDLVETATGSQLEIPPILHRPTRFRELIHEYLNRNDKQWSKLGIDLLLGSKTDAVMENREIMFLPDYLMKAFDSARIGSQPLVEKKSEVVDIVPSDSTKNNLTHPLFIFSCLFIIIALLSFSKNKTTQQLLISFDRFLYFITGLLGILFLFMWFGTDHIMCENNYNLLWAWPINIIAAFFIGKSKRWINIYQIVYACTLVLVLIFWKIIPQQLNISLIPILGIFIFRTWVHLYLKKMNDGHTILQK